MKPYGIKKKDRVICGIKGCTCGDWSSKHPKHGSSNSKNKRLKKSARREGKLVDVI